MKPPVSNIPKGLFHWCDVGAVKHVAERFSAELPNSFFPFVVFGEIASGLICWLRRRHISSTTQTPVILRQHQ